MICAHCGAPVRYVKKAGGWLHTQPLGLLRVSRREADDIRRDSPGQAFWRRRPTYIHPAQAEGVRGPDKTRRKSREL